MINLLKYDWKRNANLIMGSAAALIIFQVAISFFGVTRNWPSALPLTFMFMGYCFAALMLIIFSFKTFSHNLKSYGRRLLPVASWKTIASPLLLQFVLSAGLSGLVLLHIWLFKWLSPSASLDALVPPTLKTGVLFFILIFWMVLFLMLLLYFSITVGNLFNKKLMPWVAIAVFVLLQFVISYAEKFLFNDDLFGAVDSELSSSSMSIFMSSTGDISVGNWGVMAFEIVIGAILVNIMLYLLNKKLDA
ncbi:hypothetical protein SAMN04487969_10112 [Paenibacillus algorifonticola]|uniref:ABC-2 type transport system permease protein n=1 Tax=Paenibacillus algorifonticola TaxID=684063 RepID=A0A1I1XPV3_9BACL|nr:hypothetical protein [Paenibacillus algorifonticola]SFE09362.1 hypothetical protein SAMN04487969_10112 [Paenibacillus algorifonticola]